MQKIMTFFGDELREADEELQGLLNVGWRVVDTCSFNQPVTLAYGGQDHVTTSIAHRPTELKGDYGVIFILEREETEKG